MDPVSIFTLIQAVATATKACFRVGARVYEFTRDTRRADDNLRRFNDEVKGLQTVLDGVYNTLGSLAKLPTYHETDCDKEVWGAINDSVSECEAYLKKLVDLLVEIQGNDSATGWLPSAARALKLRASHEDLEMYRSNVKNYKENLQMSLTMVNLHICSDFAQRTDAKIDHMSVLIGRLQLFLDGTASPVQPISIESPTAIRLKKTARKVLSTANTVASARSSAAYSQNSQPLRSSQIRDRKDRNEIELWVEQLTRVDEDPEPQLAAEMVASLSEGLPESVVTTTERDSGPTELTEPDFNPEEDFNLDLMHALNKAGMRHYKNSNPEQAMENLERALQYAKKLSPERLAKQDLTEIRLTLASIHLNKRDLNSTEQQILATLRENESNDRNRLRIFDARLMLAQVYLLKRRFEEAQSQCQKVIHGRGAALGKESLAYLEAIQLLVLIYHGKGEHLEADVMLQKLPQELLEETKVQLQEPEILQSRESLSTQPEPRKRRSHDRSASFSLFHWPGSTPNTPDTDKNSFMGRRTSGDISRQVTINKDIDRDLEPQEILSLAGYRGGFDSSKALTWAIFNNHLKVVHYLLEGYRVFKSRRSRLSLSNDDNIEIRKANVEGSHKTKNIPLMVAIDCGRVMIAKMLLDRGASTSIKDDKQRSPLRAAAEGGHAEIVKLLLERGAWTESYEPSTQSRSYAPIHAAAARGHLETASLLLDYGSTSVDCMDSHGNTPLKFAAQRGHEPVAKLLLERGAKVDGVDDGGWTPLMVASYNGHDLLVKLLLAAGASISHSNSMGQTSMTLASEQGRETVVRTLIDAGADIMQTDNAGWTPLISAVNKRHITLANLLLSRNADLINVQSTLGSTALDRAEFRQDEGMIRLLKSKGAKHGSRRHEKQIMTAFSGYTL